MADAWNSREFGEFPNNTVVCKTGNVNQDLVESLRRMLSVQSKLLSRNPLWHEMNTIKSVIYKNHSQHRKEKHFRGVKMLHKHLTRLQEMDLEKILVSFMKMLPKKNTPISIITRYPCYQAVEYVLLKLMGASKLASQAINHCKLTFNHVHSQLFHGYFITFHTVIAAALSRVWVLLKDLIHNFIDCYKEVLPWLDIVRQTSSEGKTDIPPCLKTWLNFDIDQQPSSVNYSINNNQKSSSPLDEMFTSTPLPGKEYQDVPKDELEYSVVVPRNMFQEQPEFTNISQDNLCKRKSVELENAPECKKLILDDDENIAVTKTHCKNKPNSVKSDDNTSKRKSSQNISETISLSRNEKEDINNNKKKRKLDYFAQNINKLEVDYEKVPKKRKKRKKKKENSYEVQFQQEAVTNDDDTSVEGNPMEKMNIENGTEGAELLQEDNAIAEAIIKRKKKKGNRYEVKFQQELVGNGDNSTSEVIPKKKKKKDKKKDSTEISSNLDDLVILESHGEEVTRKLKKSNKEKKEKAETERHQLNTLSLVQEMNSESCELDEEKSHRKVKTNKKKKKKLEKKGNESNLENRLIETINDQNIELNGERSKKKAKKSKKKAKEKQIPSENAWHFERKVEIAVQKSLKKSKKSRKQIQEPVQLDQNEPEELTNTQATNSESTKNEKKGNDEVNKSKKSRPLASESLVKEQNSMKGLEKKPKKLKEKVKKGSVKTTDDKDFDDLFSALGV